VQIEKAVITAGGPGQRALPLQTLIDRDGQTKPALRILIDEVFSAGIREVAVVVHRGDVDAYAEALQEQAGRVRFLEQPEPLGFGHAVATAADFVGKNPFLLLVGDHLYVSRAEESCAAQLVRMAGKEGCAVSAVQPTHESRLLRFGAIGGQPLSGRPGWYQVERVLEKPTPTEAEQSLIVPGLRAGYYLCFFGMHVLTPRVLELLQQKLQEAEDPRSVHLSLALDELARHERYLACQLQGKRYDIGTRYGVFTAQLALALAGRDRELVLGMMLELLAEYVQDQGTDSVVPKV